MHTASLFFGFNTEGALITKNFLSFSTNTENFFILTRESNDSKLKMMESLLIARDKPILNKVDSSLPLELF